MCAFEHSGSQGRAHGRAETGAKSGSGASGARTLVQLVPLAQGDCGVLAPLGDDDSGNGCRNGTTLRHAASPHNLCGANDTNPVGNPGNGGVSRSALRPRHPGLALESPRGAPLPPRNTISGGPDQGMKGLAGQRPASGKETGDSNPTWLFDDLWASPSGVGPSPGPSVEDRPEPPRGFHRGASRPASPSGAGPPSGLPVRFARGPGLPAREQGWMPPGTPLAASEQLVELVPEGPAQGEARAVPHDHHVLAAEPGVDFPDAIQVHDAGPVDPPELPGIKLRQEV